MTTSRPGGTRSRRAPPYRRFSGGWRRLSDPRTPGTCSASSRTSATAAPSLPLPSTRSSPISSRTVRGRCGSTTTGPQASHRTDHGSSRCRPSYRCGASPRPGSPPILALNVPTNGFCANDSTTAPGPPGPRPTSVVRAVLRRRKSEYRRLTRGDGCRSATTGAVACLALHPQRSRSEAARIGVGHLLARETRDESTLGWEVSRLVGLERAMGQVTFYVTARSRLPPRPRLPLRRARRRRPHQLARVPPRSVRPLATPDPPPALPLADLRPRIQPPSTEWGVAACRFGLRRLV